MAAFQYRAVNLEGQEISGVLEADTQRQARSQLRSQGLLAVELGTLAGPQGNAGGARRKEPRLTGSDLVLLTRQWATLLDAGQPVEKALATLGEQWESADGRALLAGVRGELQAGHPLHISLASYGKTFSPLYRALIEAGERSGQLAQVMTRLADNLEAGSALRQKIIQAMIYPVLVVIVACAVVLGLMTYVVPQVAAVFQSSHPSLPWLTQALLAVSAFLRWAWPILLIGGIGAFWAARRALRNETRLFALHRRLMRIPTLGRLLVSLDSTRLARTLAILTGSGVPLLTALEAGHALLWLRPLRHALGEAAGLVREGLPLNRALAQGRCFPPFLVQMIASGENAGRLPEMLEKAAHQQQEEATNRLSVAMSLLEPLMILAMGVVVMIIVLAILQPLIEINQLLR